MVWYPSTVQGFEHNKEPQCQSKDLYNPKHKPPHEGPNHYMNTNARGRLLARFLAKIVIN